VAGVLGEDGVWVDQRLVADRFGVDDPFGAVEDWYAGED